MESTPENLPERLMWFHNEAKSRPQALIAAPLVEAAKEIERLRDQVTVLLGERDALHGELIASAGKK